MTAFVVRDDTHLGVDRIFTSVSAKALYENLFSAFEKDATAVAAGVVLADGYVVNAMLASSAVSQVKLKTTTGDVSLVQGASSGIHLTLPGGEYGFYPRFNRGNDPLTLDDARFVNGLALSTSFVARIYMSSASSFDGNDEITARQRYVQSSPPYDLGDGEVPLFVFVLVDSLGRMCGIYVAEDPPWAYNGPTDIRPDAVEKDSGRLLKLVRPRPDLEAIADPMRREAELERLAGLRASPRFVPLTHEIKNADMGLIPHPFDGNELTGKTVVLLDPVSETMRLLRELNEGGECIAALLAEGYLRFDNVPLVRHGPQGVVAARPAWRRT